MKRSWTHPRDASQLFDADRFGESIPQSMNGLDHLLLMAVGYDHTDDLVAIVSSEKPVADLAHDAWVEHWELPAEYPEGGYCATHSLQVACLD